MIENKEISKNKTWFYIIAFIVLLGYLFGRSGGSNESNSSTKNKLECVIDGNYSSDDGYQAFTVTIIGGSWFGRLTDLTTGNVLTSASGYMQDNTLLGEYGEEVGNVSGDCRIYLRTAWGSYDLVKE